MSMVVPRRYRRIKNGSGAHVLDWQKAGHEFVGIMSNDGEMITETSHTHPRYHTAAYCELVPTRNDPTGTHGRLYVRQDENGLRVTIHRLDNWTRDELLEASATLAQLAEYVSA